MVKRGGQGALAIHAAGSLTAPADPITVADTTGAGDAFDAAFLVEFLTRRDVASALAAANRLGGRVASRSARSSAAGRPQAAVAAASPAQNWK